MSARAPGPLIAISLSAQLLIIRILGLCGALIFGSVLALSLLSPIQVEWAARSFIELQIEHEVAGKIGDLQGGLNKSKLGRLAEAWSERQASQIAQRASEVARLRAQLQPRINATVTRLQDPDCACRAQIGQLLDTVILLDVTPLERATPQITRLIEGKYRSIVADIIGDIRIFAATNFFVFVTMLALSVSRRQYVQQLFLPALLLTLALFITSVAYIFGQNWFFTIVYADYVGYGYAAWLFLVFGLLCDIALFKARITTAIGNMLGSVPTPC